MFKKVISLILVTANYKTVKEAVDYMRNELDLYTCVDFSVAHGWNMCYVIGDATGEYGLIEVAKDEIKYMPGLIESKLDAKYSEDTNMKMNVLTILGTIISVIALIYTVIDHL